jgi:cytochrome b561
MSTLHLATGWLLAALVTLHVGAAIYHAVRGDAIMQRILPGPRRTAARSPRNAVTP